VQRPMLLPSLSFHNISICDLKTEHVLAISLGEWKVFRWATKLNGWDWAISMQVWTQQAHDALWTNFKLQYRNQIRVQDALQMEHFFFCLELLLLLHLVQHESKKDPPPPKKKERKSRNLYGIMEKWESTKHPRPYKLKLWFQEDTVLFQFQKLNKTEMSFCLGSCSL